MITVSAWVFIPAVAMLVWLHIASCRRLARADAVLLQDLGHRVEVGRAREAALVVDTIDRLRRGYGHHVSIICDDEEATSSERQSAVDVFGAFTDWHELRFRNHTWQEAVLALRTHPTFEHLFTEEV